TSATIPTCLYDAEAEGVITEGDWVIMCTFGAGLTWAGALIKWCVGKLPTVRPAEADDVVGDSYSDKLKPGRGWEDR
ncbi:MAG: 3-oxoacyl-[acyl-carrier-protein] synthase III C-terminal domain-containing protein, partial [bacterium]